MKRGRAARKPNDYCVPCSKVSYPNPSSAGAVRQSSAKSKGSDRHEKIYPCPQGGKWHIGMHK